MAGKRTQALGSSQSGQAIVLIGILILVLFGMLGLAIDSGRTYVDRRDQQTAVDAAALAAGDWYENYQSVKGTGLSAMPQAKKIYEDNLHLYAGSTSDVFSFTNVGSTTTSAGHGGGDIYGGYQLTIVATDTSQRLPVHAHDRPLSALAFMQISAARRPSPSAHRDRNRGQSAPDPRAAHPQHW